MKKITGLFFCVFLLSSSSVLAETPSIAAGNLEFGIGNLFSYGRAWNDTLDYNLVNFGTMGVGQRTVSENFFFPTPAFSFSYFIIDGLALGGQAGYNYIKEDDQDDPLQVYFLGPEMKFYIAVTESILIDAHGGFAYTGMDDGSNDYSRWSFKIGAGLNYLFTKNFAACVNLDYEYYFDTEKNGSAVDNSDYNIVSISVGFKAFITFNE